MADQLAPLEVDSRFPSGEWLGFYVQPAVGAGRHRMDLSLEFRAGRFSGDGRDDVGTFSLRGRYDVKTGEVSFQKHYVGLHSVGYRGFNEGKGIWGTWEIAPVDRGGFHIWPRGMADPTVARVRAEASDAAKKPEPAALVTTGP